VAGLLWRGRGGGADGEVPGGGLLHVSDHVEGGGLDGPAVGEPEDRVPGECVLSSPLDALLDEPPAKEGAEDDDGDDADEDGHVPDSAAVELEHVKPAGGLGVVGGWVEDSGLSAAVGLGVVLLGLLAALADPAAHVGMLGEDFWKRPVFEKLVRGEYSGKSAL